MAKAHDPQLKQFAFEWYASTAPPKEVLSGLLKP